MSALAQTLQNNIQTESVTTISATARVDYILRFSKHAVLVVDEENGPSSDVGHQFIANLPDEHNAAYVTMSAKLNDLQVRCRLVEQLFGNVLFDPEQSVAVSLINLVKQQSQPVSIIVDNVQHLSLQLLHELSQLAEIARKADYQVNVLLLGTHDAGRKVSQNLSLFNKKLSIVSANSGQLISHQSKIFNPQLSFLNFSPLKKWLVFFLLIASVSAISVYQLYQRDVFAYTPELGAIEEKGTKFNQAGDKMAGSSLTTVVHEAAQLLPATPIDVLNALNTTEVPKEGINLLKTPDAAPSEIITAIETTTVSVRREPRLWTMPAKTKGKGRTSTDASVVKVNPLTPIASVEQPVANPQTNMTPEENLKASEGAYYTDYQTGYVIQIAGFTQKSVMEEFLADYSQLPFSQYQRVVNDEVMTFITTQRFSTREQASEALASLPEAIKSRAPWIKSITAINTEISSFQRSQS